MPEQTQPKYNLIDEPWIKVLMCNGEEQKVSLRDLFKESAKIRSLAGETLLLDNAVLRVLIAILVTCFYRYSPNGEWEPLDEDDEDIAIDRFREIWNNKSFPEGFVDAYLDEWYDRFFLFGGECPFYQVPAGYAGNMSDINLKSVNGEVLESNNSPSPFSGISEAERNKMEFDEAARWLIYYMNYSDCSMKHPSPKTTFTSGGANFHPMGENLFETLMLCSVLFDNNGNLYPKVLPAWESDKCMNAGAMLPLPTPLPDNLPELYTQISRKVLLHSENGIVDGMKASAGDRYENTDAFIEPMFVFIQKSGSKEGKFPKHIPLDCTGWKEYAYIFQDNNNPARWVSLLYDEDIISKKYIPFTICDIQYGQMYGSVAHTIASHIDLGAQYLKDQSVEGLKKIEEAKTEIKSINKISFCLRKFGEQIDMSCGAQRDQNTGRLVSPTADLTVQEYEWAVKPLIEGYLRDGVSDIEKFRKEILKAAESAADKALRNVNLTGFMGRNGQSIGKAESELNYKLYGIKKELGLIPKKEVKKN